VCRPSWKRVRPETIARRPELRPGGIGAAA